MDNTNEIYLSVIVPVYNEEKRLPTTFPQFLDFATKYQDGEIEIIFIDDCSEDNTFSLITNYAKEHEKFRAEKLAVHAGKGAALRLGAKAARGKIFLLCDCDLSTSFAFYDEFHKLLSDYDIVIGSRKAKDSNVTKSQSVLKRTAGKFAQFLIRFVIGLEFADNSCGFKIFGPKATKVFQHSVIEKVLIDTEILYIAKMANLKILEKGVLWVNNEDSRFGMSSYFIALYELIKLRIRISCKQYDIDAIKSINQ